MNLSNFSLFSLFFAGALLLSACKSSPFDGNKNLKGTYEGTVTVVYSTTYQFPMGGDSVVTSTETYSDHIKIKRKGSLEYEIVEWQSGCDLNMCCIGPYCPGAEILVSEEYIHHLNWSYDFVNDMNMAFDPENDMVEINYVYDDGYFTEVYDPDTYETLYWHRFRSEYTLIGER